MKLICGLGNPGRQYQQNRHNAGFLTVDLVAERWRAAFDQEKFAARIAWASCAGERVLLLKPSTYMNESGRALSEAATFYKVAAPDVLVVHDELDLPFGQVRLKRGGGTGGHRGLASIRAHWGREDYARVRFGVGKPPGTGGQRIVGHVLGDFSPDEEAALAPLLSLAAEMCDAWARGGIDAAMNAYNGSGPAATRAPGPMASRGAKDKDGQ